MTELVTGVDLVREQLRIARGEPLSSARFRCTATRSRCASTRRIRGRFLPQAGRIERLRLPAGIRVDAGVEEGDEIGTSYDPMIAKLIAHAPTRDEALDRLAAALRETDVDGVTTNLPFLRWLVAHPLVRAGRDDDGVPDGEPAAVGAAAARARTGVARRLAAEPARPAAAARARHRRGRARRTAPRPSSRRSTAPMPGTVIRVLVAAGARVGAREPLVVLEAMKMETPLVSPYDATVRAVHVAEGDRVAGGAVLVELDE